MFNVRFLGIKGENYEETIQLLIKHELKARAGGWAVSNERSCCFAIVNLLGKILSFNFCFVKIPF